MAVPLLHRSKLNGLLTFAHPEPFAFTHEHMDLASAIAGQAATAIENARLFTHVRDERAVLEALINGVQEPIIVTDTLNRIRYANSAAAALNPALKDAVGQPVEAVLRSDKLNAMFRAMRTSGQPQRDQLTWPDERSFDVNMVLVPDVGSVAVMHDVTHFRELDRMKSEFVATVSHDLKAPLTVIYGYVELLQQALPDLGDFARTSLQEIQASAARMRDLITTLLDLAQIEAGFDQVQQTCSVRSIILDALQLHRLTANDKNITLQVDVPESLPTVQGHPVRLGQAVNNLLVNALKYTPPAGRVTVSARAGDDQITVRVADTGPGIPIAKQAGLFSKFYRLDVRGADEEEGHGLGLAIVRSVVEAHGGRVWVDSTAGEGSTFGFALPITNAQDARGDAKGAKE
jgi:two-component system NtrC family sensor kinase